MEFEVRDGCLSIIRNQYGIEYNDDIAKSEHFIIEFLIQCPPLKFQMDRSIVKYFIDYNRYEVPFYRLYLNDELIFQFNENSSGDYVITYLLVPAGLEQLKFIEKIIFNMALAVDMEAITILPRRRI